MRYRPEIDGLRALAVIPVVLFHMGVFWLPGGFIGVDVFFVISGYLITSIILKDYADGLFSYREFWLRRVRRILPALLVMVSFTSIFGYYLLYGPDVSVLGRQGLASVFSYANIDFWMHSGNYWGNDARSSPLLHTWSLSVEEQFYLFFPILLMYMLNYFKSKLKIVILLVTLSSFCLFIYGVGNYPTATFYLLPTRAWELGVGALLGIVTCREVPKFQNNNLLSIIGILLIIVSYVFIDEEGGISIYLVFPVVGTALILAFSSAEASLINKFLSMHVMVLIGKISYSLYLWHWPVIVIMKETFPLMNLLERSLYSLPIILMLSIASYLLVEKTTRRNPKAIYYVVFLFVISVIASLFLMKTHLIEDVRGYNKTMWHGSLYDVAPKSSDEVPSKRREGVYEPKLPNMDNHAYAKGGIIKLYGEKMPEIVVLGDSHAMMWSKTIDSVAKELGHSIAFYAAHGTSPFFDIPIIEKRSKFFNVGEKYTFDEKRLFFLQKWKPKVVVISSRWAFVDASEMNDLIEYIGSLESKVLFFEDPPELFFGDKDAPQYIAHMGVKAFDGVKKYISIADSPKYVKGRKLIREVSRLCEYCDVISIADIFIKENKVWVLDGKNVLYIDDDHLSQQGALKARGRILEKIQTYF